MVELVTRNFWWPRVMTEIKWYMKGCDLWITSVLEWSNAYIRDMTEQEVKPGIEVSDNESYIIPFYHLLTLVLKTTCLLDIFRSLLLE